MSAIDVPLSVHQVRFMVAAAARNHDALIVRADDPVCIAFDKWLKDYVRAAQVAATSDEAIDRAAKAFYDADPIVDTDEFAGTDVQRPWYSIGDKYQDHLRRLVRTAVEAALTEHTDRD